MVRVPWNEPYEIMKALDAGAYGVIVPMVNTREEAERAVSACRYPPDGNRSFGPIRAALYGGRGYAKDANTELACIAMIETEDGIANLEDILSTPGLDGVYIGPSDLALALGMAPVGDNSDPKHAAVVQRILDACKAHGVAAGIHTASVEFSARYLAAGFNFVTLGTDSGFMMKAAGADLAAVRGSVSGRENRLLIAVKSRGCRQQGAARLVSFRLLRVVASFSPAGPVHGLREAVRRFGRVWRGTD